jgi:hypothetical protein
MTRFPASRTLIFLRDAAAINDVIFEFIPSRSPHNWKPENEIAGYLLRYFRDGKYGDIIDGRLRITYSYGANAANLRPA